MRLTTPFLLLAAAALAGLAGYAAQDAQGGKKVDTRVFEMRTYYAPPGKMDALHARFRDHTNKLFEKHGMTLIGFWSPVDEKQAEEEMGYLLEYPSKAAADKSWAAFRADPAWKTAKAKSEENGPLVEKVESVFLKP